MRIYLAILIITLLPTIQFGQCHEDKSGVVWTNDEPTVTYYDLAINTAPMLWFSPDEELLYDEKGDKQLPNSFPFEDAAGPIVYYKLMTIYTKDKAKVILTEGHKDFEVLDLENVKAIDLDFYYYFEHETGLGSHHHDIESVALKVKVLHEPSCTKNSYALQVQSIKGRAHGVHWYDNYLEIDKQTFFPLSVLIEEGKHASCTDKNADGAFTPGYDVSKRINDAWGVRDIITSGKLVRGGYEAWMAKRRTHESILFPPTPSDNPFYEDLIEKFGDHIHGSQYKLRPYPSFPREDIDKKLIKLMKGKKPHIWPKLDKIRGDGRVKRWIKEDNAYRSLGVAYRWDDSKSLTFTLPLFIFKTVEAPMTGGYLFNKVSFGLGESTLINPQVGDFQKLISHQIMHTSSASKWMDSYVGLGYEVYDVDFNSGTQDYEPFFLSEAGIKIRLNISKTPLRFLKYFGTEFWGLRLGWKNVGFHPFLQSGFVVELGAGVF